MGFAHKPSAITGRLQELWQGSRAVWRIQFDHVVRATHGTWWIKGEKMGRARATCIAACQKVISACGANGAGDIGAIKANALSRHSFDIRRVDIAAVGAESAWVIVPGRAFNNRALIVGNDQHHVGSCCAENPRYHQDTEDKGPRECCQKCYWLHVPRQLLV